MPHLFGGVLCCTSDGQRIHGRQGRHSGNPKPGSVKHGVAEGRTTGTDACYARDAEVKSAGGAGYGLRVRNTRTNPEEDGDTKRKLASRTSSIFLANPSLFSTSLTSELAGVGPGRAVGASQGQSWGQRSPTQKLRRLVRLPTRPAVITPPPSISRAGRSSRQQQLQILTPQIADQAFISTDDRVCQSSLRSLQL